MNVEVSVAEVVCSKCGAGVGQPCIFRGRRASWRTVHAARALSAKAYPIDPEHPTVIALQSAILGAMNNAREAGMPDETTNKIAEEIFAIWRRSGEQPARSRRAR